VPARVLVIYGSAVLALHHIPRLPGLPHGWFFSLLVATSHIRSLIGLGEERITIVSVLENFLGCFAEPRRKFAQ